MRVMLALCFLASLVVVGLVLEEATATTAPRELRPAPSPVGPTSRGSADPPSPAPLTAARSTPTTAHAAIGLAPAEVPSVPPPSTRFAELSHDCWGAAPQYEPQELDVGELDLDDLPTLEEQEEEEREQDLRAKIVYVDGPREIRTEGRVLRIESELLVY